MPPLDSQHFLRSRLRAASIIRWIVLGLFVVGSIAAAMIWEYRTRGWTAFPLSFAIPALVVLAGFWLPAVALVLGTGHIARWLIPAPPRELPCPSCGYPVGGSGPCPECGQDVRGDQRGSGADADETRQPETVHPVAAGRRMHTR
jgi:hypothetical protein